MAILDKLLATAARQAQVRLMLAASLRAVVAPTLLKRTARRTS